MQWVFIYLTSQYLKHVLTCGSTFSPSLKEANMSTDEIKHLHKSVNTEYELHSMGEQLSMCQMF